VALTSKELCLLRAHLHGIRDGLQVRAWRARLTIQEAYVVCGAADVEESRLNADVDMTLPALSLDAYLSRAIDSALARLDQGTYGICTDCERSIPIRRLRSLPFAARCLSCQEKAESGTAVLDVP
jgi:DnaK suppressor protein